MEELPSRGKKAKWWSPKFSLIFRVTLSFWSLKYLPMSSQSGLNHIMMLLGMANWWLFRSLYFTRKMGRLSLLGWLLLISNCLSLKAKGFRFSTSLNHWPNTNTASKLIYHNALCKYFAPSSARSLKYAQTLTKSKNVIHHSAKTSRKNQKQWSQSIAVSCRLVSWWQ